MHSSLSFSTFLPLFFHLPIPCFLVRSTIQAPEKLSTHATTRILSQIPLLLSLPYANPESALQIHAERVRCARPLHVHVSVPLGDVTLSQANPLWEMCHLCILSLRFWLCVRPLSHARMPIGWHCRKGLRRSGICMRRGRSALVRGRRQSRMCCRRSRGPLLAGRLI